MVEWVRDYVKQQHPKEGLKILDRRFEKIMAVGFVSNIRLPTLTHLWQSPTTMQANEYRGLMQVKQLVLQVIYNDFLM